MDYQTGTKPVTLGRIVLFHSRRDHPARPFFVAPAIISKVNDNGSVGLTIFNPSGSNDYNPIVYEGQGDEQWGWPELEPKPAPKPVPAAPVYPAFDSSTSYLAGTVVKSGDSLYTAKTDIPVGASDPADDPVRWTCAPAPKAPEVQTETKQYADGASATGPAPLPDHSPAGAPEVPTT